MWYLRLCVASLTCIVFVFLFGVYLYVQCSIYVVFAALCGQFDLLLSVSASALASPHVNQAM